jgi:predicted  nucleic acid-binding Zn-ribbon protein
MIDPCSELKAKLTEIEARLKEMSTFSDILHEQEKLTRQSYLTEEQRMSIRVELKFKRDVRQQLRQERENIIDDIQDIYCAWEDVHDERYQLPY